LNEIIPSRKLCHLYYVYTYIRWLQSKSLRQAYDYWQDQPGNFCTIYKYESLVIYIIYTYYNAQSYYISFIYTDEDVLLCTSHLLSVVFIIMFWYKITFKYHQNHAGILLLITPLTQREMIGGYDLISLVSLYLPKQRIVQIHQLI